ncbi:MAG: DUF1064 domain-containing protein [Ginsengibacter sp.]
MIPKNKYRNIPCIVNGIRFQSRKEGRRYQILLLLLQAGEIFKLQLQVPFKLEVNGFKICTYKADFVYYDKKGNKVVEDTKGVLTPEFKLKQKLMKAILEVEILLT